MKNISVSYCFLHPETADRATVTSATAIGVLLLFIAPSMLCSLAMGIAVSAVMLAFAALGAVLIFVTLFLIPQRTILTFDFTAGELTHAKEYFARLRPRAEFKHPLDGNVEARLLPVLFGASRTVELQSAGVFHYILYFKKPEDAAQLVAWVNEQALRRNPAAQAATRLPGASGETGPQGQRPLPVPSPEEMARQLRGWGIWLLIMGALQMVVAKGYSPWGVLLIVMGLASFVVKAAPMFMIYAVTIAWAGIQNLQSTNGAWQFGAIVQFFFSLIVYGQFLRFRIVEKPAVETLQPVDREESVGLPLEARSLFPALSFWIGLAALAGYVLLILLVLSIMKYGSDNSLVQKVELAEPYLVYGGVLALGAGLASLQSGYRRRWMQWTGAAAGMAVMAINLGITPLVQWLWKIV